MVTAVSSSPIDEYLAGFSGRQRESLEKLRRTLREELPDAEEGMSYGLPCFKVGGRAIAGFGGYKNHNSYFPHSGSVLERVSSIPEWCSLSKGTLRFPLDRDLSRTLVQRLIRAKFADLKERG